MYTPAHFNYDEAEVLKQHIRQQCFGMLVVADAEGIEVNHVPFYLQGGDDQGPDYLHCHLARSNSAWQRIRNSAHVLAVFSGPNTYVSPSWYPSKQDNGRAVPTWNYLAIHVSGQARAIEDTTWLAAHVRQLSDHAEKTMEAPWSVDDAPGDYIAGMLRAIVGIEIKISQISGKLKASQNQPELNRQGVIDGLDNSASSMINPAFADLMK